ncbi:tyrosine-type recombinase/integrase [Rheinheimera sp. UJ51]|uniref:tyrosine-type recombinase/integrase n=1 Tax=Rheinheimera sp. UJ51 TaxID=2892446 RepID=UPI001E59BCAA|nr:tyrosine-type recombinase/integrase [Rheinheimera sp. UJ51]MCC5452872.1 tyrosine-type recombinase/integrase [Rheinheimera sp. UJ51]
MQSDFISAKNLKSESLVTHGNVDRANHQFDRFLKTIFARMPINSQKAMKSDWSCYQRFIKESAAIGLIAVPDDEDVMIETMLAYVDYLSKKYKIKTIRRRLHHLKVLFSYFGCPNPLLTSHELKKNISLTIKSVAQPAGQAEPLTADMLIEHLSKIDANNLMSLRNAMIVNLAYDSLCRASEMRMIKLSHIDKEKDGTGTVFVERTKSDREAIGAYRYISKTTMELIEQWKERTGLSNKDYLVRALTSAGTIKPYIAHEESPPVSYEVIVSAFKAANVSLSGHSARVGAVIDMVKAEISIEKIQLAGGWRDQAMPLLYSRKIRAKNSAAAEMARKNGR